MTQKIIKTGNSLGITIPAEFAKILGLRPGQIVHTTVNLSKFSLTYTFTSSGQLSLLSQK